MTSGAIRSVLVIEDQAIVACDLQRFLDGIGYRVVGPVGSPDEALSRTTSDKLDGAVVDVKLVGDASRQISEALKAAKVPHILDEMQRWNVATIKIYAGTSRQVL